MYTNSWQQPILARNHRLRIPFETLPLLFASASPSGGTCGCVSIVIAGVASSSPDNVIWGGKSTVEGRPR